MATAISMTTLESAAYDNIISLINDKSIVTDPRDVSGTSKRLFVYDSDPLHKSINFGDFPYIIAEFPTLEYSKVSTDGKVKHLKWSMGLTVRTAKDGAGQGTSGAGKNDMFTICDSLQALFNSITHRQTLEDLNMFFAKLTKDDVDSLTVSQKQVYQSTYTLTFETRMVVSS